MPPECSPPIIDVPAPLGPYEARTVLVLLSHGVKGAQGGSMKKVAQTAGRLGGRACFDAYLSFEEPSLSGAIAALAGAGGLRVIVIPMFLAAGRHLKQDVPEAIEKAVKENPGVRVDLTRHLGADQAVAELTLLRALEAEAGARF